MMAGFEERLRGIRARIDATASKAGRLGKDVTLVAVTKGVSAEKVREALDAGLSLFGENRVQEARSKQAGMPAAEWHLIGHLQTNKAREAVSLFGCIQSVDSLRLAEKLNEVCVEKRKVMPVLLEVNVSLEAQKHGFSPDEAPGAARVIAGMKGLRIQGLMGMAPHSEDEAPRREAFRRLREIFDSLKRVSSENWEMKYLSMGMSDDFEMAIEEGSNMVRIGRALFA